MTPNVTKHLVCLTVYIFLFCGESLGKAGICVVGAKGAEVSCHGIAGMINVGRCLWAAWITLSSAATRFLAAPPGKGEVMLQVKSVGICGSDVHYWQHGEIGDFKLGDRLVLGHETAGVVHMIGEGMVRAVAGRLWHCRQLDSFAAFQAVSSKAVKYKDG